MTYLVAWSGGADSTAVLQHYAEASSVDYPVRAISIVGHPQLLKPFMHAQEWARLNYLAWAKKKGMHIKHERISMSGNFELRTTEDNHWRAQPLLWLSVLIQEVGDGDEVLLGYIRHDNFWHVRNLFADAFAAGCALKGVTATLNFFGEWWSKADVLERLRKARVPDRCWFTCESTPDGKPCGTCSKCKEVDSGRAELAGRSAQLSVRMGSRGGSHEHRER
jgi:hypothetical protein